MNRPRLFLLCLSIATMCTLAGCFPATRTMPDASFIRGDDQGAEPPDCDKLVAPSGLSDAGIPRPTMAWGCATYSNLAAQVANPKDLFNPDPLGPTDANVAASAVRRYRTDKVTPLDTTTTRSQQ